MRVWLLLALAAVALLASGAPVFRDSKQQATPSATRIFNTILAQGYRGWTGYRTCLPFTLPKHELCWAELHRGNRYRVVEIDLDLSSPASPMPTEVAHYEPWTRAPVHIAAPEGSGTANTRQYGWEYLMRTLAPDRLPTTFFDVDGNRAGYPPTMFLFHCSGVPTRITCRNALGDQLTYAPNA